MQQHNKPKLLIPLTVVGFVALVAACAFAVIAIQNLGHHVAPSLFSSRPVRVTDAYKDIMSDDVEEVYRSQEILVESDIDHLLQMTMSLNSGERYRGVQAIARFAPGQCDALERASRDEYYLVRYWSLVGLRNGNCNNKYKIAGERVDDPFAPIAELARKMLDEPRSAD
jgi:hypothetical protein